MMASKFYYKMYKVADQLISNQQHRHMDEICDKSSHNDHYSAEQRRWIIIAIAVHIPLDCLSTTQLMDYVINLSMLVDNSVTVLDLPNIRPVKELCIKCSAEQTVDHKGSHYAQDVRLVSTSPGVV